MTELSIPRPTAREIAIGMVLDLPDEPVEPLPTPRTPDPLTALEQAVRPALRRQPCFVGFSGGLDSSLVLAVAVRVARAEGLADPVPVTLRFPDAPETDESVWQDAVIRALGLADPGQVITLADELDVIGPVAQRLLRRYGVLHPANTHGYLPMIDLARGGSLLTGVGGDQMLGGIRSSSPAHRRPRPLRAVDRLRRLPAALHRRWIGSIPPGGSGFAFEWLQPAVADQARDAWRTIRSAEPDRLDRRIGWHLRRRDLVLGLAGAAAIGADHDVWVHHPLLDPGFLATLAAREGHRRHANRDNLLTRIARDALPPVVTAPRHKAAFNGAYLRRPTREFVRSWDGSGIDPELIDPDALRQVWSRWPIPAVTSALIQQLWMITQPDLSVQRQPAITVVPRSTPPTDLEAAR